jgi:hypothetical protein
MVSSPNVEIRARPPAVSPERTRTQLLIARTHSRVPWPAFRSLECKARITVKLVNLRTKPVERAGSRRVLTNDLITPPPNRQHRGHDPLSFGCVLFSAFHRDMARRPTESGDAEAGGTATHRHCRQSEPVKDISSPFGIPGTAVRFRRRW